MKKALKYIFIVFFVIILTKCANQQSPPGGPKDLIPPQIIYIYPENGTLNFSDNYFEIEFSEYVDKLSLLDALFISPEVKNLEYDWTGTSVIINFDDTLSENTTYTLSVGSNIKDLNNKNQLVEALNISFSTGDKIDVGKISGKIFGEKLTGAMVFAYAKSDTFANPIIEKPQNITQIGDNGDFNLMGLKNGEYRLFALKDESGNRLYNIGDDAYGITSNRVFISDSSNSISGIKFKMTVEDTVAPFISNVTMTDKNHLSVEFSEYLDSSKIGISNLAIYDSTTKSKKVVKYLYQGNKSKFEYFLSFSDSLKIDNKNYLIAENIVDKSSNNSKYETYEFVVNEKQDTIAPKIKSISTPFEKSKIDYLNPSFTISYDDGISLKQLENAIKLEKYNWQIEKNNDANFIVKILNELETNEKVDFSINHKLIKDAAGNGLDSVQKYTLETLSGREFSGLSGKIDISDTSSNIVVVIENTTDNALKYSTNVKKDKTYNFERILPGKYKTWLFDDKDKNGKFNYGKIVPFEHSEEFYVQPDTLNLRARWPVGDVNIKTGK